MPDVRKNGLRRFAVPAESTVNTDLTQNQPQIDPRFAGDPEEHQPEPVSGVTVSGPATAAKVAVQHQKELAETLPAAPPQRGFLVEVRARRR